MALDWTLDPSLTAAVEERLAGVVDPCSTASVLSMSIVELGLVRDVTLDEEVLTVHLRLTSPSCVMVGYIAREVIARLGDLPGVTEVRLAPDEGLDWDPSMMDPRVAEERHTRLQLLELSPQRQD
jgi:metal-sulfur cluster biosynthetic enzyme